MISFFGIVCRVRKREIAVEFNADGFLRSGLKSDVCQHALMLPVLLQHLRFQKSLDSLEVHIGYQFKDRSVLQQALTHPSFPKMNFGTNSDHAQNSITNCGIRNIEYGDKIRLFKEWRKRGLTTLIRIMSYMPTEHEARSEIYGNDRLEFLGDAVLEFIVRQVIFTFFSFRISDCRLVSSVVNFRNIPVLKISVSSEHLHCFMIIQECCSFFKFGIPMD